MVEENWGSVAGDGNAEAIFRNRRDDRRALTMVATALGIALAAVAIWYAFSGGAGVLALLIFLAASCSAVWVHQDNYQTLTFVMIAERRVQLIEQRLQAIHEDMLTGR